MTSTFAKTGGAISKPIAGSVSESAIVQVDPEQWVTSLFRALKDYLQTKLDSRIYEIIGNFPADETFTRRQPFAKTIIHFEYDDITNPILGFGDNVVDNVYDDEAGTILPIEGKMHLANFDIGIWASARSGGDTSRMEAYQLLNDLFTGTLAYRELRDNRGIEVISFSGANFFQENIDDLSVWRVADITLQVRVFSKTTPINPYPYIGDATQIQDFSISTGDPILDS